jgi:O-antigen ligase
LDQNGRNEDIFTPSWANLQLALVTVMLVAANLSIAISQLFLGLALLVQLYRRFFRGESLAPTGVGRWVLALAGWAALMIPFSSDSSQSLVFYKRFYLFVAIWVTGSVALGGRRQWILLGALLTGALAISLAGQVHALQQTGALFKYRLGEMSNPMTSGCLLMLSLLVALGFLLTGGLKKWRLAWVGVPALPVAVGLAQTMTRSAWLGLVAGVGVMLLLLRPRLFALFTVAVVVILLVIPRLPDGVMSGNMKMRFDLAYLMSGNSTSQRILMWHEGWAMLRRHPITGVGDRDLKDLGPVYYPRDEMTYHGHLHSNPVMLAAIWGVPGLVLGMGFLFLQIKLLVSRWWRWARHRRGPGSGWILAGIGCWTGFFVAGFTEWYFGDAESMLLYLAITGVALSLPLPSEPAGELHV